MPDEEETVSCIESVKGYKKNESLGLGFRVGGLVDKGEAIRLTEGEASERESDLLTAWGAEVIRLDSKELQGKYFLRKEIEGKRIVSMLVSLDEDKTRAREAQPSLFGKRRKSVYSIDNLLVSQCDHDACVELLDWTPDNAESYMFVRQGDRPNKKQAQRKSCNPTSNFERAEVYIDTIDSLEDVASFIHEAGHAQVISRNSHDENVRRDNAIRLREQGVKGVVMNDSLLIDKWERAVDMDLGEALNVVKGEEHEVNDYVDTFISETQPILEVSEEETVLMAKKRQKDYQSYDLSKFADDAYSILFPGATVSERATQIQQGHEAGLERHYQLTRRLIEVCQTHLGAREEWATISKGDKNYRVLFNKSFLNVRVSPDEEEGVTTAVNISFCMASIGEKSNGQYHDVSRFSLANLEEAEETVGNIDQFIELEEEILAVMEEHFEKK